MEDNFTDAEHREQEVLTSLHKVLGSCNINFLFGAGVNGKAFPDFSQFTNTIKVKNDEGLRGNGIEAALAACKDEQVRQTVLDAFVSEYNNKEYELDTDSCGNLKRLLRATHTVVSRAENRHPESKRINVFTLNYDRIVEEILEGCGFFTYTLTSDSKAYLPFNVVGYNTETRTFIPTFAVYKLHGSVDGSRKLHRDNIVFPGADKLGNVISHFYETLFSMKGELLRKNSVLFVIGYSWKDAHVNDIIGSAVDNGLTVIFPQYKPDDKVKAAFGDKVILIPPAKPDEPCDTTLTLAHYIEKAMA